MDMVTRAVTGFTQYASTLVYGEPEPQPSSWWQQTTFITTVVLVVTSIAAAILVRKWALKRRKFVKSALTGSDKAISSLSSSCTLGSFGAVPPMYAHLLYLVKAAIDRASCPELLVVKSTGILSGFNVLPPAVESLKLRPPPGMKSLDFERLLSALPTLVPLFYLVFLISIGIIRHKKNYC